MAIDYSALGPNSIPKGTPRVESKRASRLSKAELDRTCRIAVKKRDKGRCVVPGCKEASDHLHHITYRSKGGKWRTENICSLCSAHHQLVHLGKIDIEGNADVHLTITGARKYLAFRL